MLFYIIAIFPLAAMITGYPGNRIYWPCNQNVIHWIYGLKRMSMSFIDDTIK